MTQGATSAGAIHSDFEHLIPCKFAATLAWKMIAGNRVTQSWERDGSPLQRYPGDSQKWIKSPKKERGQKVGDGGSCEKIGMTWLWGLQGAAYKIRMSYLNFSREDKIKEKKKWQDINIYISKQCKYMMRSLKFLEIDWVLIGWEDVQLADSLADALRELKVY